MAADATAEISAETAVLIAGKQYCLILYVKYFKLIVFAGRNRGNTVQVLINNTCTVPVRFPHRLWHNPPSQTYDKYICTCTYSTTTSLQFYMYSSVTYQSEVSPDSLLPSDRSAEHTCDKIKTGANTTK